MLVGLHKNPFKMSQTFMGRYCAILEHNGIPYVWLDVSEPGFWAQIPKLDLFLYRFNHYHDLLQIAQTILPIIESEYGVRCFPDQKTCWHYDDKIKQAFLLERHGFPMVKSYAFFDKAAALQWLETAALPVVFKLKGGAGSSNVSLIRTRAAGEKLIRRMFGKGVRPGRTGHTNAKTITQKLKNVYGDARRIAAATIKDEDYSPFWQVQKNYVLFQEFLPDNAFDTRITVIGDRAFGFRRMVRENDFRASGGGKIDHDQEAIDLRCVAIAHEISGKLGFQSMAYDFIYDPKGEPQICEISYAYADWAVQACPGYWDREMNYVEGHFWPQYCILSDCLALPGLKQPELPV